MTILDKLTVSLTKHGSHKVAALLEAFSPDEVIAKCWNKVPGINIDAAQARKILSASNDDKVPKYWHDAKKAGRTTIDGLVLLAIVFSHHRLIKAMSDGTKGFGVGTIERVAIKGKAYSNIKGEFENLNALTVQDQDSFSFDIRPIIRDANLGRLALSLFRSKLLTAQWSGKNDLVDECIAHGFNGALGLSETQFRIWTGSITADMDDLPEVVDPDSSPPLPFKFKAGHRKRKSGDVTRRGHGETATARLIHNDLQNKLFEYLSGKLGKENVGTELKGGPTFTSIDLVVRTKHGYTFYEIKTSRSLRKCIREAIPQLLEYAYWPAEQRASELVIVSTNVPTSDARAYLENLRTTFAVPIYHYTISRRAGSLSRRI